MEYVLCDTDIFDPILDEKFDSLFLNATCQLEAEKVYKFIASFHVDLLRDLPRFDRFILPETVKVYKRNKNDEKDKMYDVLSFQLKQLEKILLKNHIEYYSSTIQGDNLESANIIKIEIVEDTSKPVVTGKGKKRQRMKVSSIVPSKPCTANLVTDLASKRLSELYGKFVNIIRNKKIMSEILGVDETNDDNILIRAFVKEYGELWLATSTREQELWDKLKNKTIEVLEKYQEK